MSTAEEAAGGGGGGGGGGGPGMEEEEVGESTFAYVFEFFVPGVLLVSAFKAVNKRRNLNKCSTNGES